MFLRLEYTCNPWDVTLALSKSSTRLTLPFTAMLGIDAVDGMDKGKKTPPPVLTYAPRSFGLDMLTMVVGSGLGEHKKILQARAPSVNPADFFAECRPPACYFVAEKYGHMDMLVDDHEEDTPDIAPEEIEVEFRSRNRTVKDLFELWLHAYVVLVLCKLLTLCVAS
ncbi:hypothetical protein NL676_029527 [Syzygium grande]|nr:hypothetical protein NL676_029527 [Syzygium grande]